MKITVFEGDEKRSADWPWWTLVEAIIWIVGEEGYVPPSDNAAMAEGDLDFSAREWAAKQLHIALARGHVTAYGIRSEGEKAEAISPVDWNSRHVPISEFRWLRSWQYEPYNSVVVRKDEIKRHWPVPLALEDDGEPLPRRGRPDEYDWPIILKMACEEQRRNPSGRKLYMIVQARCRDELRYPEGQPSVGAIRYQLRKARNKSP